MFDKKIKVLWGVLLVILFIGLGIFYNNHRNSQPLKPVIIYKYTEPPERPLKSVKTESTSQEAIVSDSEPELEPVETLPVVVTEMPQNDTAFEVFPELERDAVEPAELSPEEAAPFDFKTTPEGYPLTPYWDQPADRQKNWSYNHKLIDHVLVKLWREGVQNFEGGSIDDTGRVRPHYTNTLYVDWDESTMSDGTQRPYISYFLGPVGVWKKEDFFDVPPPSIHLIDVNSPEGQGIDPYTFLTSTELP